MNRKTANTVFAIFPALCFQLPMARTIPKLEPFSTFLEGLVYFDSTLDETGKIIRLGSTHMVTQQKKNTVASYDHKLQGCLVSIYVA